MFYVIFVLSVLSVAYAVPEPENHRCCENSTWTECGTACPETCPVASRPLASRPICTQQCVKGCECKPGFVKNETGNCIRREDCPKICGENQHLDPCPNPCQATCSEPEPPVCNFLWCYPECVCNEGFVLDERTKSCVPLEKCEQCGPSEVWTECGSSCPLTCEKPHPGICNDMCKRGCVCKEGLVLDADSKCIDPSKCPDADTDDD